MLQEYYVIFGRKEKDEEKPTRYAYDLKNKIVWQGSSGGIIFCRMEESEIIFEQESGTQSDESIRFIDYGDVESLCSWLEGAEMKVVREMSKRYYKNKVEGDPNFQMASILKDIYEILKENK